jgi:hypothetical protein
LTFRPSALAIATVPRKTKAAETPFRSAMWPAEPVRRRRASNARTKIHAARIQALADSAGAGTVATVPDTAKAAAARSQRRFNGRAVRDIPVEITCRIANPTDTMAAAIGVVPTRTPTTKSAAWDGRGLWVMIDTRRSPLNEAVTVAEV